MFAMLNTVMKGVVMICQITSPVVERDPLVYEDVLLIGQVCVLHLSQSLRFTNYSLFLLLFFSPLNHYFTISN